MARVATFAGVLLMVLAAAFPLAAQNDHGIEVSVFVGGNKPLQDLNTVPSATFKTGIGAGAGVAVILDKNLALRLDGSFAKSDITSGNLGNALVSNSWSRIMIGADFVLRFPMENGITPYFTTGGGAVMFKEGSTGSLQGRSPTRAAGRFGAGLKFPIGDKLGIFGQANAWVYDFNQSQFTYFTKVQVDMALTAGVSFTF